MGIFCRRIFCRVCNSIWLLVLYGIVIIAMGNIITKTFFASLLLPLFVLGICWIFSKKGLFECKLSYSMIWWSICIIGTIFMVCFCYFARMDKFTWDWGKVMRSASVYVLTGRQKNKIYFTRYPNNQFWYLILVIVFKIIHWFNPEAQFHQFYMASIILGCFMVTGAIVLLYLTAKELWGEKKAVIVSSMAYLCIPLYMWASYAYTDTAGMFLLMLLIFLYIKAEKCDHIWQYILYMGLIGLVGAVAWAIKVTICIFVMAVFLTLLLKKIALKKLIIGILIITLLFSLGKISIDTAVDQVLPIDEEFYDQYEFPLTHWIMMSLKWGGYVKEDVDFTASFPSYKEKQKANIEEIGNRLKERGFLGNLKFFFYDKQMRTWGDSTFAGCEYLSRKPLYQDGVLQRFVTKQGDMNWLLQIYTALYYGILLVGIFLSAFFAWRGKRSADDCLFVGRLTMLGVCIFLTVWECNSRYLVLFLPLMMLLCAEGYIGLRQRIRQRIDH